MDQKVPILCYHRVHEAGDCPPTPPVGEYCGHVVLDEFRRQMSHLVERGFSSITHRELADWIAGRAEIPERAVLIDFDDNRIHVRDHAAPVMRELGLRGTVFVISGLANGDDLGAMSTPYDAMDWGQLRALREEGWLIGAHTRTHPELTDLIGEPNGPEKVRIELRGGREEIAAALGTAPVHFAYPVGLWNEEIERMVKEYFDAARLWEVLGEPAYNTRATDPYRLRCNNISAHVSFDRFRRIVDGVGVTPQSPG